MEKHHLILGIIIVILGAGLYYAYSLTSVGSTPPAIGQERGITKIGVLNGHEFDLELENGERVHAVLTVDSTPEATEEVIKLINKSINPRIVVLDKRDNLWVIELHLTVREIEFKLSDWLVDRNMIWERH